MANNISNKLRTGKPDVVLLDNPNGTTSINGGTNNTQNAMKPISELTVKTTSPDEALDYIPIFEASSGNILKINKQSFVQNEVLYNAGALSGAVPAGKELGVDTTAGTFYYKNGSGNWQQQPVGTQVNLIDNTDGTLTINASLGGTQKTVRDFSELTPLVGTVDSANDRIALYDASTSSHVYVNSSQIGVIPNVRFGTVAPTVLGTDKKGDEYIITPTGDNTTTATDSYVFDGTAWMKRSGGVTVSEGDGITLTQSGIDYNIAVTTPLPVYTAGDAEKSLKVNTTGTGLEWVGDTPLVAQLAPVLDNTIIVPPATPNISNAYIIPTGATGAWAGHVHDIATWNGSAWIFYTPQANDITTVQTGVNAGTSYKWDATVPNWVITIPEELPVTAGGVVFSSHKTIESKGGGVYIYKGELYAWGKLGMGINGATLDNSIHSVVPNKYNMSGALVSYEPEFVDVVYNSENIFATDQFGFVWASGKNTGKQLGYPTYATTQDLTAPTLIPYFKNNNIKIKKIVIPVMGAGNMTVAAITESGSLYLWGDNTNGQLGQGNTTDLGEPKLITGFVSPVVQVAMSPVTGFSIYAVLADGKLMVCGRNANGQLGLGNTTQRTTFIQSNTNVKQVEAWSVACICVKNDGTVFATGANTYGVLGQGNTTQQTSWVSVKTTGGVAITNIDKIVINAGNGAETGALITNTKKVMLAGRNTLYELGLNNTTQQNYYVEPTLAQAPFQGLVKDVVLTGNLSGSNYVSTTTGEVWSAGRNSNGNRGVGNITAPTATNGLGIWTKANYPNLIINIKGMGYDDNSYIATSIYALDVNGGVYTHGHQEQVATDGIITTAFYSPYLAPTPYTIMGTNSGVVFSGSTASANGTTGLVPAPLSADSTKFLRGDGVWADNYTTTLTGTANPNLVPPSPTSKSGDFYLQTDDGTLTGVAQATWFYSNGNWIQVGGFQNVTTITNGAVRTYYPTTTALQEKWGTGIVTAGNITAWGFSATGTGASVTPDAGGAIWNGYALIALRATEPTQPNTFTAPTSYARHEIAITPNSDNSYFMQVINETDRTPVLEVWVCDPITGVPLANGRICAQSDDTNDINANAQSWWRSPQNTTGILDAYRQWMVWNLPKSVINTYKTATNTIKLAIRPGYANGNTDLVYVSGFAMAKLDYGFNYTTFMSLTLGPNETSFNATNGGNIPTGWATSAGVYTGYVPNAQNRTMRIPITDTTKDIYLTTMGLHRPTADTDGGDYALYACNFTLKHASGDVVLGRPRYDIYAPSSKWIEQGYRPMGWIIPAATLAAKVTTPSGSILPYLSINIDVPAWISNNGHFAGFITEEV